MPQQVQMQFQLLTRRGDREHRVVELLEGRPGPEQSQPRPNPGDVRIDRDVAHPEGE
jgi:hypothetical protein